MTAGHAAARKVSTSLAVRCAFLTYRLPTDWYFPAGEPRGLVWAQHGFAESRKVWTDFATRAASAGFLVVAPTMPTADLFGCTVQNLGNNDRFLGHVAEVFGPAPAGRSGAPGDDRHSLAAGGLDSSYLAALRKSRLSTSSPLSAPPVLPDRVAFVGRSAGGEAALYLARRLIEVRGERRDGRNPRDDQDTGDGGDVRRAVTPSGPDLAGVVLADPVSSMVDRTMAGSLAVLDRTDVPVLTIASPPNSCNAHHRGVRVVVAGLASRAFIGVQITTGSHADLLGPSVGALERRVCGTPATGNIEATQLLAVGWLAEMLGDGVGSPATPGCYPGGTSYEGFVREGVIAPLR